MIEINTEVNWCFDELTTDEVDVMMANVFADLPETCREIIGDLLAARNEHLESINRLVDFCLTGK